MEEIIKVRSYKEAIINIYSYDHRTRAPQQIEKVCSKPKITISKPNPNIVIYCVNQTQTGQFEDQITKGLVDFRTTILGIDKLE